MIIEFIGFCIIKLFEAVKKIIKGEINFKNTLIQAAVIGYDSLSISLIICLVAGAVLSMQVAERFILSGADAYVGGLVSIAIIREIAPVFASLAIGARAGTAITAEIGNMGVTEQLDALKTLKVDPVEYLLIPRLIAGVIVVPLVTILAELIGIIGGMFVADATVKLHPSLFINSVWLYTDTDDIRASLIKAAVFGVLVTLICTCHGLRTTGGAKEIGIATTNAAIWTAVTILLFDLLLSWIFFA
ncbi:MAG TPA: ABC transporter permease [Candidatus Gastranaerophilales bacterium]|nr:ABC transporter permease [Candidatus Gastranaerophilales bacterium]